MKVNFFTLLLLISLAMQSKDVSAQFVKQRNTSTFLFVDGPDFGSAWGRYDNQFIMKPNLPSWTGYISTIKSSYDTKLFADDGSNITPTSLPPGAQPSAVEVNVTAKQNYINYWYLQYSFGVSNIAGESFLTKQANANTLTFGPTSPITGGGSGLLAPGGTFLSEIYILSSGGYPLASLSNLIYSEKYYSLNTDETEVTFASLPGVVYQGARYSFYTNSYANIDPDVSFTLSPVPELPTIVSLLFGIFLVGSRFSRKYRKQ